MSFILGLKVPHQEIPTLDDHNEMDKWLINEYKYIIEEIPLGADSFFYRYWHIPSLELNLNLISLIYEEGLILENTSFFDLEKEVEILEKYWIDNQNAIPDNDLKRLLETSGEIKNMIKRISNQHLLITIS